MKKIITSVFILIYTISNAQIMHDFTETFDSVFSFVSRTDATTGILYNRVIPFSNATSFNSLTNNNVDTITSEDFLQSYNELYLSAFNPSANILLELDELKNVINATMPAVPIGVLHYKYNTIDSSVASIKLYFDSDSVLRENTFINQSLYVEKEIFISSPLLQKTTVGTTSFKFSTDFLYDNCSRNVAYYIVDFNDGAGARKIFADTDKILRVTYENPGKHVIHIRAIMNDSTIFDSFSYIICQSPKTGNRFSYTDHLITAQIPFTDYSGKREYGKGTMRVYYSHSDHQLRKPLLILDGFDPNNSRKFEENTDDQEPSIWDLLCYQNNRDTIHIGKKLIDDYGYDLILLDFDNGGDYIERNSMVCIEAINKINTLLSNSGSEEQIVIIGPSMGGQIARYALSYMEHNNTTATTNYGYHNCRLWISMDSPHQGANISLGTQAAIYYFRNLNAARDTWEKTLNCPAAKQMLIHHFNGDANNIYRRYYNNLLSLGYPMSPRNIAISDGAMNNVSDFSESMLALHFNLTYVLYNMIGNIRLFPSQNNNTQVFKVWHIVCGIPFFNTWTVSGNSKCSIDAAPGGLYKTFDILGSKIEKIHGSEISTNIHNHCFMPITSTLDIHGDMDYCSDISSRDLVAEGLTPFDSYAGVMDSNMYHVTFNQQLVDYMLNEIDTYVQGPREVQLCTRPTFSIHLPQDSTPNVTWLCSDNIRLQRTSNPYEVSVIPLASGEGWISAEISTLKHRKRLANYPLHISLNNANDLPIITYTTIPQQTMTITGEMLLPDTLSVERGKTLTIASSGVLHCAAGARIIVRPGGKLVVDGGVLTSSCANEMWHGIEIVGDRSKHQTASNQGVVELKNGAVVENAYCGVRTGFGNDNWTTTGGIIKADNAYFINNQRAVEFLSYVDTVPTSGALRDNYSYFNKCEFKIDNDNLFDYNDCNFIDHVTLWEVKGVKFNGCTFTNQTSEHQDRRHAIYALDAGISIDSYCNNSQLPLSAGCDCPQSYSTYNTFSGFSKAVEVVTSGDQFAVKINHAFFNNNETAMLIRGNNFVTVSRCEVDLQSVPTYTLENRGLVLDNCSGYKVEDNSFSKTTYSAQRLVSTGIYVDNSGNTVDNSLHINSFTSLNYGIYVKGRNGNSHSGLQITCCNFDHNGYDIFMTSGSSIRAVQGWTNKGADNDFSNTRTSSIHNAGSQYISYYHSDAMEHIPYNVTTSRVAVIDQATANNCESTLCNPGAMLTFPSLTDTYYEAVHTLMADTLMKLDELEQWHTFAQPVADPYSLSETQFQNTGVSSTVVAETMEETSNYSDFHALKALCRLENDRINWYDLTEYQIDQLKAISESNTGRSSVMAKGVLCFIFGICYEDEWFTENANETRSANAMSNANDAPSLSLYPNPVCNVLNIELSGSLIENVHLFDLQGRIVGSSMSINDVLATVDVNDIPSGVYFVQVISQDGKIFHQRIIKN